MKKTLPLLALASLSSLVQPNTADAHGWVNFPSARQNTCFLDGGFWANNIPNKACQAAFDKSGAYPFVQRNEVASLNADYRNIETIKAAIPNGTLCSAGQAAKSGLDIPSPYWQKTTLTLDSNNQFELVFTATAPHNPSFWEFYLTRDGHDFSKPLNWDDLELIDTAGNTAVGSDKNYRIKVTIPEGRKGDAILYTRWQRVDPAGEGFYNCSDIVIKNESNIEPDPIDKLNNLGAFYSTNFPEVNVKDAVRFRTFDENGHEQSDVSLTISDANQANWQTVLAAKFNAQQTGNWFVGIWHEEMNHYMFDSNDLYANRVWSNNSNASYQLSLVKFVEPEPTPDPTPDPDSTWDAAAVYNDGDTVEHNKATWRAHWWTKGDEPGTTGEWGVWRKGESVEPTPEAEPTPEPEPTPDPEPENGTWSSKTAYLADDKVTHNGKTYTAQWWTQGDEPGTTGEWGVWR